MPDTLAEGLFALLFLLIGIVLPLVLRIRGAAQRRRQLGGLQLRAPGLPSVSKEEEPEEEPVTAAAAAPEPPPLVRSREAAPRPLSTPGRLQRLRQLTPWQQAVVWAEILGPPRGLQ
jgi:hypothetical protein